MHVGTGALLSKSSYQAMTDPNLLGFGHTQANCDGVLQANRRVQLRARRRPLGSVAAAEPDARRLQRDGGVPALEKIAVAVFTTYLPGAFDCSATTRIPVTHCSD